MLLGRADLQVKINGVRVDLTEVERCLCLHPQVKEAACKTWPRRYAAGHGAEAQGPGVVFIAYIAWTAEGWSCEKAGGGQQLEVVDVAEVRVVGSRTTCASTASSSNLCRANAWRPVTHCGKGVIGGVQLRGGKGQQGESRSTWAWSIVHEAGVRTALTAPTDTVEISKGDTGPIEQCIKVLDQLRVYVTSELIQTALCISLDYGW
jgi:hypothetical protein